MAHLGAVVSPSEYAELEKQYAETKQLIVPGKWTGAAPAVEPSAATSQMLCCFYAVAFPFSLVAWS